jgi:LysR family hydrogen peroxide-inducible transcriptional activator
MNLRDLQYLVAVAEHKNFSKAAEHCAISQPTLSNQIKKLEAYLDVQIFERDPHLVRITPVGSSIITIARNITENAEKIREIARYSVRTYVNKIIMGGFPTLANYVFPEYVFRLKQHFADLKIQLIEEKTDNLIQLLTARKIDVALLALPIADEWLEGVALFEDPFYVAVPDDHAFANRTSIEVDELASQPLLLLDEGHCLRSQILKLCSPSKVTDDDFRAASLETLRVMVKHGLGITLMPSIAISEDEQDIRYVPLRCNTSRTIGLFWHKSHERAHYFRALAGIISYKPVS